MSETTQHTATAALVVGIVGCGVMGRGIAQIAALGGARVLLADARDGAAEAACATLGTTFDTLSAKGKLDPAHARAALALLQPCSSLDQLASCNLVIEAIVEALHGSVHTDWNQLIFGHINHPPSRQGPTCTRTRPM